MELEFPYLLEWTLLPLCEVSGSHRIACALERNESSEFHWACAYTMDNFLFLNRSKKVDMCIQLIVMEQTDMRISSMQQDIGYGCRVYGIGYR